jgi:protein-tyrosine phosphatase
LYLLEDFNKIVELFDAGVLIQINMMSLAGYYSPASKEFCKKLIDSKMVHFVGSDCHNIKHMEVFRKTFDTPEFAKLSKIQLLNNLV